MKKLSLAKRNALLSSRSVSSGVFALVFALFALLVRFLAPNFFWYVFTPVFETADAFSAKSHTLLTYFGDAAKLATLNEKLTTENEALVSENMTLTQKIASQEALLGAGVMQKSAPGILAGVIARPPTSPYDTLVLAAGKKEGVMLGMEAFGEGSVPVGLVSSVLDTFSQVTLFSAPNTVTNGWVGHAGVPLQLKGAGAGAFQASVARAANIAVGDAVFVPGPGMLPIGTVVRIDSDPLSPGVTLRILPMSNPSSLSWVLVRATGVGGITFATSTLP